MASSLDFLVYNLFGSCEDKKSKFTILVANRTEEQFELLLRKGVYPYKYMDSWERFNEMKLPPEEAFYSNLNMK